jgi:hypothetical protein
MRGAGDLPGEVVAGLVGGHVVAALPERAFTEVKNFALERQINRLSGGPVKLRQFWGRKFFIFGYQDSPLDPYGKSG